MFLTPQAGWIIWNIALGQLFVYTGATWNSITQATVAAVSSFQDHIAPSGTISPTANAAIIWSLPIETPITVGNIAYSVATADNSSNLYSFGIYNNAGTLLASTVPVAGTSFCPSTGFQTRSLIGATAFPAGVYYLALTGNAATLALNTTLSGFSQTQAANAGTTTGATLPSSISAPITTWTIGARPAIGMF